MVGEVDTLIIAKGKKSLTFSMADKPEEEEFLPHMLGRTGNLRAPTLRRGNTLLVGFSSALYESFFEE